MSYCRHVRPRANVPEAAPSHPLPARSERHTTPRFRRRLRPHRRSSAFYRSRPFWGRSVRGCPCRHSVCVLIAGWSHAIVEHLIILLSSAIILLHQRLAARWASVLDAVLLAGVSHCLVHGRGGEFGRNKLQKVRNIRPKIRHGSQRRVDDAALKKIFRAARLNIGVAQGIDCDIGKDSDAQTYLDIGLADVGVDRVEADLWLNARLAEGIHDLLPAAMSRSIDDERILRNFPQREAVCPQYRMADFRNHATRDLKARQFHQMRIDLNDLGSDREIRDTRVDLQ